MRRRTSGQIVAVYPPGRPDHGDPGDAPIGCNSRNLRFRPANLPRSKFGRTKGRAGKERLGHEFWYLRRRADASTASPDAGSPTPLELLS